MESFSATPEHHFLNVGMGRDVSIRELSALVARAVGFEGNIRWDSERPDGTPRKLLDVSRLASLGWRASTPLEVGISRTLEWFEQLGAARQPVRGWR